MNQQERLKALINNKETDYADDIYLNPVKEYIDSKIDLKEKEVFFKNSPICIGAAALIPDKGDWFTVQLINTPILVVRKNKNNISAYLNICSHRGARIAEGTGKKAYSFKCPYHSWVYSLDGKLIGRPREKAFEKLPKSICGLKKLKIHNLNGFLWLTLNSKSEKGYKKNVKILSNLTKNYNVNNYHFYKTTKMYRKLNWKLAVDTFLELYHIDHLHNATLGPTIMSDLGLFDSFGPHIRITGARTSALQPNSIKNKKEFDIHTLKVHILFPNTILVTHSEHIEIWHVLPGDKENECEVTLSLFSKEKIKSASAKRHWENNFTLAIDVVREEDFPLGEGVQKGFYADPKRKLIFGKNEPGLQHFHKQIKLALTKK